MSEALLVGPVEAGVSLRLLPWCPPASPSGDEGPVRRACLALVAGADLEIR
jgi:hypothetical protein